MEPICGWSSLETSDFFLPALSLQPLVENAVRHGVTKREEGGTIWISARETEESYQVTIRDDGVGLTRCGCVGTGGNTWGSRTSAAA